MPRAAAVTDSPEPKRQEFAVAGLSLPISHYTDAVRFGDMLFVSGLTAHDGKGVLVGEGDAAKQTCQILNILVKVLEASWATFADILKVTVFLSDIDYRTKIIPVRQRFFSA